jgi:hypothetical protein
MGRFLDPSLQPKILWKSLDYIGVHDKDFAPVDICPDRLNSFFTSSSNVRRPTVQCSTGNFVPSVRSFALSNVNSRDVFIAIHRIGSNAIGLDEVPLRFIKIFLPSILPVIAHIFNTSLWWFLLQKSLIHLSLGTLDQ